MSISLFFSNRLEALAEKLAHNIASPTADVTLALDGPMLMVPNPNLAKWLKMTLSETLSICMNVRFQYLESGLWEVLTRLDDQHFAPKMLDSELLKMILLYLLKTLPRNREDFDPFYGYMRESDDQQGSTQGVKLWQLTEKISQLFMEYEYHRAQMLNQWENGQQAFTKMGRCQQALYLRMKKLLTKFEGNTICSLRKYADALFSHTSPHLYNTFKMDIHLLGVSHISPMHMSVIKRLTPFCHLFIYALNPCREYWEDVQTPGEKKWVTRQMGHAELTEDTETLSINSDPENDGGLLALWGKPGRENIHFLCQLAEYDFHECFVPNDNPHTLLHHLQNHVLFFSAHESPKHFHDQDGSLQITACPGILREVESVYNSILYNLESDDGLQLTDMAILVPDMAAYRPVIDSVFGRGPERICYNLVDARADQESLYGQGVMKLLDLAENRFSRKAVFDLLLNPCVMEKWKITHPMLRIWAEWAEALNIFHSYDAAAKQRNGYMATSPYTWQLGLKRLRLSRIMAPPGESSEENFSHFQGLIPYSDVHTGDLESIGQLSVMIETLHRQIKDLKTLETYGSEWKKRLRTVFDTLLAVPNDARGEDAIRNALYQSMENLERYDQIRDLDDETNPSPALLDFFEVREFVRSGLAAITGGRGDYLTEGITISALLPMRPIPFQVVYVLGMEEGNFPGREDVSNLDLRNLKRQPGDVNVPERNRYLFLEMLMSVRKKLYITYVRRDLLMDRVLKPCSVLNQLIDYLNRHLLPFEKPFQIAEIPLKNTSEKYLLMPPAGGISDMCVNYAVADRISALREGGFWDGFQKALPDSTKHQLKKFFPDFKQDLVKNEKDARLTEKISINQLRYFLEDPVAQSLKRHLGIYDEETVLEEITLTEDEPFFSVFPNSYHFKMAILNQWMADHFSRNCPPSPLPDPLSVQSRFNALYDQQQRTGHTPEGAFAELDRKRLFEEVMTEIETLNTALQLAADAEKRYHTLVIGKNLEDSPHSKGPVSEFVFPSLPMQAPVAGKQGEFGNRIPVEVEGLINWVWRDGEKQWHTLVPTGSGKKPRRKNPIPDKYVLRPLLFWFCLYATKKGRQFMENDTITIHVAYREATSSWTYVLSKALTVRYLSRLVTRYLDPERPLWLPFEPIVSKKLFPPSDSGRFENQSEALFQKELQKLYDEQAPPLIQLADPLISLSALSEATKRFNPFFDFIHSNGGSV